MSIVDENDLFQATAPDDQQEDENDLPKDKMGDPSESVLFNADWTVATISQQIDKKNIDLDPKFQRRSAWDPLRKSRFIESLIIGLPIPNIVLAESKISRGKFMVIDGKQRLTTIHDFVSNKNFKLKGLNIREDLNDSGYEDLQNKFRSDADFLDNSPIRTVVMRNWPTDYFLYVIFDRLNSGSLPLSPQELRRALQPGELLDHIDDFLESNSVIKHALGLSRPDRRMRDSEIVLRFIAFERKYPEYDGDFKAFLDEPVRYFNSSWQQRKPELDTILRRLETALSISAKVFEPHERFKKWNGERFERRINRALLDAITRFFSDPQVEPIAISRKKEIVDLVKKLCAENVEFKRSIELTTKTPLAVHTRLSVWGKNLAPILGWNFDPDNFRIHP